MTSHDRKCMVGKEVVRPEAPNQNVQVVALESHLRVEEQFSQKKCTWTWKARFQNLKTLLGKGFSTQEIKMKRFSLLSSSWSIISKLFMSGNWIQASDSVIFVTARITGSKKLWKAKSEQTQLTTFFVKSLRWHMQMWRCHSLFLCAFSQKNHAQNFKGLFC